MSANHNCDEAIQAQVAHQPMHSTLAQRLAELRNTMGEIRVLKVEPDHLILLVVEGDPEPFLLVLKLEALTHQIH